MKERRFTVTKYGRWRHSQTFRDGRWLSNPPVFGEVPELRLRGKWLEAAGFPPGASVHVLVGRGRLLFTSEHARRTSREPLPR